MNIITPPEDMSFWLDPDAGDAAVVSPANPDSTGKPNSFSTPSIPDVLEVLNEKKRCAAQVAAHYLNSHDVRHQRIGRALMECGTHLVITRMPDESRGKVQYGWFCRRRECPVCQWRNAKRWQARFFQVLPRLEVGYSGMRFIVLTLTVRNPPVEELRSTIQMMSRAFTKMLRRDAFRMVKGVVRTTEVTHGVDGTAHPHFHCLLMVEPSFLAGRNYICHHEWRQHWQRALLVDYEPQVHVKVLPKERLREDVWRAFSYAVKPAEMIADLHWFITAMDQLSGLRLVESSGTLRDVIPKHRAHWQHGAQYKAAGAASGESGTQYPVVWDARQNRYRTG